MSLSFWIIFLVANLLVTLLMLGLSHPVELRRLRWIQMAASYPLVNSMLFLTITPVYGQLDAIGLVIAYGFCAVFLGAIWSHNVGLLWGMALTRYLEGGGKHSATLKPDLRQARIHIDEGELPQAIESLEHELEKDPFNFEILHLLAAVHKELKQYEQALNRIDRMEQNPDLTDQQREVAEQARLQLEDLRLRQKLMGEN